MSRRAGDRNGEVKGTVPPPTSWLPGEDPSPENSALLADQPVEAPVPGVDTPKLFESAALTEPIPLTPAEPPSTPTAFETVTQSTMTAEPPPAATFVPEPPTPSTTDKLTALTVEHPEYLIAAALIGGFVLAKVVKRLAA